MFTKLSFLRMSIMKKYKKTAFYGISTLILSLATMPFALAIVEPPKAPSAPVSEELLKTYKKSTQDTNVIEALETLRETSGEYSRKAILGDNLTSKPIKIEFKNLAEINPAYTNFDALGWKKNKKLYIYINKKHQDAPKEALAALLAHEAIHQDELNSLNEETYAWTLEAAVWTQLSDNKPELQNISHPLVERENVIKKLFEKGNYTSTYIRKFVVSNKGYQNLPERSPGFEENL